MYVDSTTTFFKLLCESSLLDFVLLFQDTGTSEHTLFVTISVLTSDR